MSAKPILRPDGIGARLQEERLRLGYSQTAFGEICGVKKVAMFNYERGERHPDTRVLAAIDLAGGDILYIVTGRRSSNVSQNELASDFKKRISIAVAVAVKNALEEVTNG